MTTETSLQTNDTVAGEQLPRLLVVDDEIGICNLLKDFFTDKGFDVSIANNGEHALEIIERDRPHLVFLDVKMPGISGLEVLRRAKQMDSSMKAIMVTAVEDDETMAEARALGAIDYVTKPFSLEYLEDIVLTKINSQLYEELRRSNEELKKTYERLQRNVRQMVLTLANIVEAKDEYTGSHQDEVVGIGMQVGQWLVEHDDVEVDMDTLEMGLHLHDLGKQGIPDPVLNKPGPLNEEEWALMKLHPEIGAKILEPVDEFKKVADVVMHHQEMWDGTGYPDGLKGDEIPIEASIVAVSDAFHAMTSDRIYRKSPGVSYALEQLRKYSGTQFDPKVVQAFLNVYEAGLLPKSSLPGGDVQ